MSKYDSTIRTMSKHDGFVYALGTGIGCIAFGFLLTLTIIGALVGLPLILLGCMYILSSPVGYKHFSQAECPMCGTRILIIHALHKKPIVKCRCCKEKLLRKGGRLCFLDRQ